MKNFETGLIQPLERHSSRWNLIASTAKHIKKRITMLKQNSSDDQDLMNSQNSKYRSLAPSPDLSFSSDSIYEVNPGAIPSPISKFTPQCRLTSNNGLDEDDYGHSRVSPLDLPEILENILSFLDDFNPIPSEPAPVRRKPLSFQHALLIHHPDVEKAKEAWACAQKEDEIASMKNNKPYNLRGSGLFSCLTVSHAFRNAAIRVINRRATFHNDESWQKFVHANSQNPNRNLRTLVLHKVRTASIPELQSLGTQPRLEWLELHVCPNLYPTEELLGPHLRKIAVPGSGLVNDEHMFMVARMCPNLKVLDLRACELVTDEGLIAIAQGCPKLKYLNVGRVNSGSRITSKGVEAIAKFTKINTLGLAGCHITDSAMWAIAQYRGNRIERLSLNGCDMLSNSSIPKILVYTPNLQVLELRGCTRITDVKPIVEFKKKMPHALVEGCEIFEQV